MSHSMAIDPRRSVMVTWTPIPLCSTQLQHPSPGVGPDKAQSREASPSYCNTEPEYSSEEGAKSGVEVYSQISGHFTKRNNGGRPQQTAGPILLSTREQDIHLTTFGNAAGNTEQSSFSPDDEGLRGRRHSNPDGTYGQGSENTFPHPATIPKECRSWDYATYQKPQLVEGNGRKSPGLRSQDALYNDGISGLQVSESANNAGATEPEVSNIAIQTEPSDILYVSKDTLVAYTIAVVQNMQTFQFEQMQIAFQTAQNQASIETLLLEEQLMHAHFNLALLQNSCSDNKQSNAKTNKTTTVNTGPSTSATEQEMCVKTTYRHSSGNKCANSIQLTSTVPPTCRQSSDVINRIPAGYESDDSWNCHSPDIEQTPR